jgi:hypothetical protein
MSHAAPPLGLGLVAPSQRLGKPSDVTRYRETLDMLERGATPREVADAAAALAAPPNEKQGKLF